MPHTYPPGTMGHVYWVYDETCIDIATQGYVGVTSDFDRRRRRHKSTFSNAQMISVFEGSIEDCYYVERMLRPSVGIGWNKAAGGYGSINGIKRSEETLRRMSIAQKKVDRTGWRRNLSGLNRADNPMPKKECPHCHRVIDVGNFAKYHGENCRFNPTVDQEMLRARSEKLRAAAHHPRPGYRGPRRLYPASF